MKRLTWIFIALILSAVISGCGSLPAATSTSTVGGNFPATTSTLTLANTCSVVLPENLSLVSPYAGECLHGQAHGNGKVMVEKTYQQGEKLIFTYDGMFQHGQFTGRGKETEKFGTHWFEGTFNEWKHWTGTVYFAKTARQKERQINLREGSITSQPVDATQDTSYSVKASDSDKEGAVNSEQQALSKRPQEVKSGSKPREPIGNLGVIGLFFKSLLSLCASSHMFLLPTF